MPSSLSHAMAAVALSAAMMPRRSYRALAVVGVVCAIIPDLDALPRLVGGGDLAVLGGHRGITHSVLFALAAAGLVTLAASKRIGASGASMFSYVALATLSHGVLDAFTDYGSGQGVAFLSPFWWHRFKAPWQPIGGEFSELLFCLIPLTLMAAAAVHLRKLSVGVQFREDTVQLGLHATNASPKEMPLHATSGDDPLRSQTPPRPGA